jgi:hypothetical protein
MPYVLLMIDEAGEYPMVVDETDKLLTHGSAQWRLIAQVDTRTEGEVVAAAWRRAKASYSHGPNPGPQPSKTPDASGR